MDTPVPADQLPFAPTSVGDSPAASFTERRKQLELQGVLAPLPIPSLPKRKPGPRSDAARQDRALRQGRGEIGPHFTSFIQVRRGDFVSHGVSEVIPDAWGSGLHDCLGALEGHCQRHLVQGGAQRIHFQVPLRREDDDAVFPGCRGTRSLATALGIKHPTVQGGEPMVLTTDALAVNLRGEFFAFYVRYESDVPTHPSRDWELLQLARAYWTERQVRFAVYTEVACPVALTNQLIWAFDGLMATRQARFALHAEAASPVASTSRLTWALDGLTGNEHAQPEFLDFLTRTDHRKSFSDMVKYWPGGRGDAVRNFKVAVSTGAVQLSVGESIPPLTRVWSFRVRSVAEREAALSLVVDALEARHG